MAELLRCQDRWGREILLTAERWDGHILIRHPELRSAALRVERALTDPDRVTHDRAIGRRKCFYRRATLPRPFERHLPKVCVQFRPTAPSGAWVGEVITAYPVPSIRPDEVQKRP